MNLKSTLNEGRWHCIPYHFIVVIHFLHRLQSQVLHQALSSSEHLALSLYNLWANSTKPRSELIVAPSSYSSLANSWSQRTFFGVISDDPNSGSSKHLALSWSSWSWLNHFDETKLRAHLSTYLWAIPIAPSSESITQMMPWAGLGDQMTANKKNV